MKETICTIPVNEVFEEKCGCPICKMRNLIETKYITYITGAAMMEPDIRVATNKEGFCERHLLQMISDGHARLPIALILQTHLEETEKKLLKAPAGDTAAKLGKLEESCFVCSYMEHHLARHIDTLMRNYKSEPEFRLLFSQQEYLCLPHYKQLLVSGKKALGRMYKEFSKVTHELALKRAKSLEGDIAGFVLAFDYRNAGKEVPAGSKDAIEKIIHYITSRHPSEK
ncbi:MAG: DUF6062 family protein [Oscillospiraceae bacterium]|jgi:hypothetical protein|nr:DUF6062 family protein [Oscillospiraceae bacterium]